MPASVAGVRWWPPSLNTRFSNWCVLVAALPDRRNARFSDWCVLVAALPGRRNARFSDWRVSVAGRAGNSAVVSYRVGG